LASADLYGTYREYREREPVHKGEASHPRFPDHWFLFRHEDVSFVLKDPRFGRDWHPVVKTPPPPVDIPPGALSDLVAMVIQRGARFPLEDVEVGGVVLRRGSQVTPILGAANRDPEPSSSPIAWTSAAMREGTWPSVVASTAVWAHRSPGSRFVLPSTCCSTPHPSSHTMPRPSLYGPRALPAASTSCH
jgi:hypothetical protein